MGALAASLAPADYVDPDVYARECESVLAESWLPLCRVDQLGEPGAHVARTLVGRPLLAVRDGDAIRVLANVCAHRGSLLVDEGAGSSSNVVCPYHRWAYRLDGTLIGAPLSEGADLDGVCLRVVRHAIWEGFVLVDLSGTAPDPQVELAGLADHLAPWRWSELSTVVSQRFHSTWNWKVMVENWIECYHHIGTHRDSVEPTQPARTTKFVASDGAPWAAMTVDCLDGVEGPADEWMPGVGADHGRELSVWGAFPLLIGGSMARYAFWLQVLPIDAGSHDVIWHVLAHRSQLDRFDPDRASDLMEMFAEVHVEDMETCARVQAGLASGLLDRLRLTPLELGVAEFQRWMADRTR